MRDDDQYVNIMTSPIGIDDHCRVEATSANCEDDYLEPKDARRKNVIARTGLDNPG
jgi:hypothetical protein